MPVLPTPQFDRFYRHEELGQLLQAYAQALPRLLRIEVAGNSHEGREIWVAVLTNQDTGADADKPALWVDGNIHAAELTASTACLYYLHQLASGYGSSREIGIRPRNSINRCCNRPKFGTDTISRPPIRTIWRNTPSGRRIVWMVRDSTTTS